MLLLETKRICAFAAVVEIGVELHGFPFQELGDADLDCAVDDKRRFLPRQALLRGDDATQGVTARQHDTAMIDFRRRGGGWDGGRKAGEFDEGSATGGAPVGFGLGGNDGVAMAAGAFHVSTILYS
jgi:hypothetical protein